MENIRERLETLITTLKNTPHINVRNAVIGDGASSAEIGRAKRAANGRLPTDVEAFYRSVGWFKLEWKHTVKEIAEGDMCDQGFINILPIEEVWGNWAGIIWFGPDDESEEEEEEDKDPSYGGDKGKNKAAEDDASESGYVDYSFRPVRPFDTFVPEACMAFLQPVGKGRKAQPADQVAFHYCGEELCKTRYTFAEYIDRLIASRGMFYWCESLCVDRQDSAQTMEFRRKMPVLFPDYDDSLFQP
ncbi:hypothetical protein AJ80_02485 [Polytolypa hystricis UAMH7299]|uniref:Uncharacterized protein n=1 Tax=Polytolypa hystricis (strain UAMH7299) TaxID=1447883 RepID=A0A2B7YR38_POLH7|nr:hypothetical protein AJ80_02485 [Polytolypa hystricis UAMH7299]